MKAVKVYYSTVKSQFRFQTGLCKFCSYTKNRKCIRQVHYVQNEMVMASIV